MRARGVVGLAVVVMAAGSVVAVGLAERGPSGTAASPGSGSVAAPTPTATSPVVAGGTGITTLGLGGWQVQSGAAVKEGGARVSAPGYPASSWLSVAPDDAGAPGTEIEALLQNGGCPNVFFSTNMRRCLGFMDKVGPVTVPQFAVPWWFRTTFPGTLRPGEHAALIVNGVVGEADVWLNGTRVATKRIVEGAYTRYSFDVTDLIRPGANALALEISPNDPKSMFTLDDVDWNQIPPDNNTGLQFPVQLAVSNAVAISNAHVVQDDAPDLSVSRLTVKADVANATSTPQSAVVSATITPPPGGGTPILVHRSVTIPAGATQTVTFDPADDPNLVLHHPQVWWPYQLGDQPLYRLSASVEQGGVRTFAPPEAFGIRTVTTRLVGPSKLAPQGVRSFSVNGVPIVIRGGGWSENLFLHYSSRDTARQISLIKNLGLNAIRTEGKEMPEDFYEQMDRAGILIDAGFQCCDRWQLPPAGHGVTPNDYRVLGLSARTIGERLRDHPSVINYSWSDNAPTPKQEQVSAQGFAQAGFPDPVIASAEYKSSPIYGQAGEKEGPYDWVPPAYWYDTTHSSASGGDPSLTNVGGSWGFDSEQSAGDTVPTLDSIRRFLSPSEQAKLWKRPAYNQYHTNYEPGHHGYNFGTLFNLDRAIERRYGPWSGLDRYVQEAQVQNYEDVRAQFEAFIDHSTNTPTPSTGTIYWMLNKGWPSMLWTLYNDDFDQAGSYFGAQEANRSVHALYAYDDGSVTLDNLSGAAQSGLSVESDVVDLSGHVSDHQVASGISLPSQGVKNKVLTPKVPAPTTPPAHARASFVELLVRRRGRIVDRNVYWLSTQPDVVNWPRSEGDPQATMMQYADLRDLQQLPSVRVRASATTQEQAGPGGTQDVTRVRITNPSDSRSVAFFLRADVRRGTSKGTESPGDNEVLPILWNANDITLRPGESQTLSATYRASLLEGAHPVVSLFGWNVARSDVAA